MNKHESFLGKYKEIIKSIYKEIIKVETFKDVKELPSRILFIWFFYKEYNNFK